MESQPPGMVNLMYMKMPATQLRASTTLLQTETPSKQNKTFLRRNMSIHPTLKIEYKSR